MLSNILGFMPFRRGLSLSRIDLKSGLESGFSAQHSLIQSLTQSNEVSSGCKSGLESHELDWELF